MFDGMLRIEGKSERKLEHLRGAQEAQVAASTPSLGWRVSVHGKQGEWVARVDDEAPGTSLSHGTWHFSSASFSLNLVMT